MLLLELRIRAAAAAAVLRLLRCKLLQLVLLWGSARLAHSTTHAAPPAVPGPVRNSDA
jgi:hypothetical protein